jgi:hypothetical protein
VQNRDSAPSIGDQTSVLAARLTLGGRTPSISQDERIPNPALESDHAGFDGRPFAHWHQDRTGPGGRKKTSVRLARSGQDLLRGDPDVFELSRHECRLVGGQPVQKPM